MFLSEWSSYNRVQQCVFRAKLWFDLRKILYTSWFHPHYSACLFRFCPPYSLSYYSLGKTKIYINSCPKKCNTKQSIYYSTSSLYMFRVSTTPVIKSKLPRWREAAAQKIWPVPEVVVTVLCTPNDGCVWYPKHVEWTCRIISRLLCVASRWIIINIDKRCSEP